MRKISKNLISVFFFIFFIFIAFGSDDSSSGSKNSTSRSSGGSSKHTCRYCGKSFTGRGYTTAMRVVNRVDDEYSPLNSYCSYKCASDCIATECFAR
jgi:hypothetical protein